MDGGHIKWVFVLPLFWSLILMTWDERRDCLSAYATIFAVSIVPGILVAVLAAAGVPLTFGSMPVPNTEMANAGTQLLTWPGALFIETNAMSLPWGGTLFRMSGVYDEPGTVGTSAALLLAALRYEWRDWRVPVLFVGGLLSFSLAFAVLTALGLILSAFQSRRIISTAAALAAVTLVVSFALGFISFPPQKTSISIRAETKPVPKASVAEPTPEYKSFTPSEHGLRQQLIRNGARLDWQAVDNRELPSMKQLREEYLKSGFLTLLTGIASDASVVRSPLSQSVWRILTDHGLIGALLLASGAFWLAFIGSRQADSRYAAFVFLLLFFASVYQRPVIWMPYMMLLLVCGPAYRCFRTRSA